MVKLACDQVGHGDQMPTGPIAPGPGFGGLNETIGAFNTAVVQMPVKPDRMPFQ